MKKNICRFIGFILSIVIVVSSFPAQSYAAEDLGVLNSEDVTVSENSEGHSSVYEEQDVDIEADEENNEIAIDETTIEDTEYGYETYPEDNIVVEDEQTDEIEISDESDTVTPDEYVYEPKSQYDLVFKGYNNGQEKILSYKIPASLSSMTVADFLNSIGKYNEVYPTFGGFIDNEETCIGSWHVSTDGSNEWSYDDENYDYADPDLKDFKIKGGKDYYFTACISRVVSDGIYAYINSSVYFNGRSHVLTADRENKTACNDLYMVLTASDDKDNSEERGAGFYYLEFGKDYTVKYRNNKFPSQIMLEDGSYISTYTDNRERPCVSIIGKGTYAGFSADIYFEILPYNFSISDPAVELSGLKKTYALKNGKIDSWKDPAAIIMQYDWINGKYTEWTTKLKKGTDYTVKIYRYDNSKWIKQEYDDPKQISQAGDYLYTLWGCGNYCGLAFDRSMSGDFSDGSRSSINPEHYDYEGAFEPVSGMFQFRVAGDIYQDLANATVSIKKSSINFDGKFHTGDDFGLTVSIGTGKNKRYLTEDIDYIVTYDGNDFSYISSRSYTSGIGYLYHTSTCNAIYESKVGIANTYKVTISAKYGSDYFGKKETGKKVTIKGVELSKNGYKKPKSLSFNGRNTVVKIPRSRKGIKNGLYEMNIDSIGFDNDGNSNYLKNINANPNYYSKKGYAVLYDYYNAAPGNYNVGLYTVGGGLSHKKALTLSFTRKKMSFKDAVKKGYLNISIEPGEYNAGGAMPGDILVSFLGNTGYEQNVTYSGQRIWTPAGSTASISTSFIVRVTNNKKAGDGAKFTISGSPYFTGSYTFKYSISPRSIYQDEISVVNGESWYRSNGQTTPMALYSNAYDEGELVATVTPVSSLEKQAGQVVKLFQTYYKNREDELNEKLSLAPLSSSQYQVDFVNNTNNSYSIKVCFTGTPLMTGFDQAEIPLEGVYSDYSGTAAIVGATVRYNGETYEFDSSTSVSLPYEGRQIRFDRDGSSGVVSVTLKDGTVLSADDFRVEYGDNINAKKGGGTFKIILKYNEKSGTFLFSGEKVFKFNISESEKIIV